MSILNESRTDTKNDINKNIYIGMYESEYRFITRASDLRKTSVQPWISEYGKSRSTDQ